MTKTLKSAPSKKVVNMKAKAAPAAASPAVNKLETAEYGRIQEFDMAIKNSLLEVGLLEERKQLLLSSVNSIRAAANDFINTVRLAHGIPDDQAWNINPETLEISYTS